MQYQVSVNTTQSVAVNEQDFRLFSNPFSLWAGEVRSLSEISIAPTNDTLVEGDEVIALNVVSTTPGVNYSSVVTVVLQDDDFYQVSVGDASVKEGNAGTHTLDFPVTLSQASGTDTTINWTTASGSAVEGSDFNGASGSLIIPAGQTAASIGIPLNGDRELEADESFTLTITTPAGTAVRVARATATGTILNDDNPSVSLAGATVSEEDGSVTVTATLSAAAPFATSVSYNVINGTALRDTDFTGPASGVFTFPAGARTASISFTVYDDAIPEADETFSVQLGSSVNLTIAGRTALVTIRDNDAPSLQNPVSQTVTEGDEGSQAVTIQFNLASPGFSPSSVDWSVSPDSTAVEAASGKVTFAAGSTSASLNLLVPGNRIPQPSRSVNLILSNPVNLQINNSDPMVLTVLDNDERVLSGSGFSVNEGNNGQTTATFRLSIPATLDVPVSVDYETIAGSALAGSDFVAARGTATIPAGSTQAVIPVSIIADAAYEETESFTVKLSNPVNATLASTLLTGFIQDDDAQPSLSVNPSVVTSSPGGTYQAWLQVSLGGGAAGQSIPVSYKVSTRDGSGLAGIHYTPVNGKVLTFKPGSSSEWITVTVSGVEGEDMSREFFVDFTPVNGPSSTVTAAVTIEPLRVTSFSRLLPELFSIRFPTGKGQNYIVQEAESLTGPWTDNSSILQGSGSPVTQVVSSAKRRGYFRVRSYSNPPSTPAVLAP